MPSITKGQTLSTTWDVRPSVWNYSYYTFKLETKLIDQYIDSNTSKISVTLYLKTDFGNTAAFNGGTAWFYTDVASNGGGYTNVASNSLSYFYGTTSYEKVVSTKEYIITHNADGTGSYAVRGRNTTSGNANQPPASNGTITSITLPTIPRAATLSVTPSVINKGANMTVKVTPPNSTFTTTTTYKVGSTTVSLGSGVTGNRTYTVSYATLASYIGSYTSGVVTVTCQTYNGSTLIGTTSAKVTVQTGVIPMSWVDDRNGHVGVTVGQKASASDYDFRVYLDSKFTIGDTTVHEALRDYVIEQGTSGDWTYRKWASGVSECWLYKAYYATGTTWGPGTEFIIGFLDYPADSFIAIPSLQYTVDSNPMTIAASWATGFGPAYAQHTPSLSAFRPDTDYRGSQISINVSLYAKGRWK